MTWSKGPGSHLWMPGQPYVKPDALMRHVRDSMAKDEAEMRRPCLPEWFFAKDQGGKGR